MPSFGQQESARAIRDRVGQGAHYSAYAPPAVVKERATRKRPRLGRLLWGASLIALVVVLAVAVLVALGI
jgi:hypothetical protein